MFGWFKRIQQVPELETYQQKLDRIEEEITGGTPTDGLPIVDRILLDIRMNPETWEMSKKEYIYGNFFKAALIKNAVVIGVPTHSNIGGWLVVGDPEDMNDHMGARRRQAIYTQDDISKDQRDKIRKTLCLWSALETDRRIKGCTDEGALSVLKKVFAYTPEVALRLLNDPTVGDLAKSALEQSKIEVKDDEA